MPWPYRLAVRKKEAESVIYLELFLEFLKIGAFSFGGGYGMISLMRDTVLAHGWLTEAEMLNVIATAESTPGPIAVNMATFVGSTQGGPLGALVATVGVVLPAFLLMLLIASVFGELTKKGGVKAFLGGARPAVTGMILATAFLMLTRQITGFEGIATDGSLAKPLAPDLRAVIILALIPAAALAYKKLRHRPASPILLIALSAVLGIIAYSI